MTAPAGNDSTTTTGEPGGDGGQGQPGGGTDTGAGAAQQDNQFAPITSQADFDKAFNQRWSREQAKIAEQYKGYDDLKAKADKFDQLEAENQTPSQRLESAVAERDDALQTAAESDARAEKAEKDSLKLRIAIEEGLPPKFAARLTGDTEDDLRADAKETFGEFISSGQEFDHGPRSQSAPQSMNDLIFGARKGR